MRLETIIFNILCLMIESSYGDMADPEWNLCNFSEPMQAFFNNKSEPPSQNHSERGASMPTARLFWNMRHWAASRLQPFAIEVNSPTSD